MNPPQSFTAVCQACGTAIRVRLSTTVRPCRCPNPPRHLEVTVTPDPTDLDAFRQHHGPFTRTTTPGAP